jgi:hypothetical protein
LIHVILGIYIRVTVAVVLHVFHARSENVNVKFPFDKKLYHVVLIHVNSSEYHVRYANTFLVVDHVIEYDTLAVGFVLSILFTVAKTSHVFHARSKNVNKKFQLPVNVYHVALFQVSVLFRHVRIAITSWFVNHVVE